MKTADSKSEREDYTHEDIHSIDSHVRNHRADAVLHSYEPSLQGHEAECCRSRPDTDVEISCSEILHLRAGIHNQECGLNEYPLDSNQKQGTRQGYAEGARQNAGAFPAVAAAVRLGCQTARSHTQETEVPVKQIKQHGTDGYATDHRSRRYIQMSCNGYIHHTDKGHGDVGQYAWNGQFQYVFVDWFHYLYLPSSSSMPR